MVLCRVLDPKRSVPAGEFHPLDGFTGVLQKSRCCGPLAEVHLAHSQLLKPALAAGIVPFTVSIEKCTSFPFFFLFAPAFLTLEDDPSHERCSGEERTEMSKIISTALDTALMIHAFFSVQSVWYFGGLNAPEEAWK